MDNTIGQRLQKTIAGFVIIGIVILLVFMSIYNVGEGEQAVVTTFGKPVVVSEPGLKFRIPFIQKATKVITTNNSITIGYDERTNETREDESLMITSDYNFVNVDFYLEYKVIDPIKFLYEAEDPAFMLKNLAQSYIRDTIGKFDVDSVITTGKNEIQAEVREKLTKRIEKEDMGIQVITINIQDSEPPTTEILEAFKAVETAKQGKETTLNNANKYKNEKEPEADANIDEILKNAQAVKESRINEAEGQVARFNSTFDEYIKFPLITKQRMFYETMEEVLPSLKVIIDNGDGSVNKILPIDNLSTIYNVTETKGDE